MVPCLKRISCFTCFSQTAQKDQRRLVGMAVKMRALADRLKSETPVERNGGLVGGAHLQRHGHDAAPLGFVEQCCQHRRGIAAPAGVFACAFLQEQGPLKQSLKLDRILHFLQSPHR